MAKPRMCPDVRITDEDCYDSYAGQINCRLVAINKKDGRYLGRIDYVHFENRVHVDFIEVEPEARRCGIASKLLKKLEKEQPNILYGLTTIEGHEFLKKYKKRS